MQAGNLRDDLRSSVITNVPHSAGRDALPSGSNDQAHGAAGGGNQPQTHTDSMAKKSTSKTCSAPAVDREAAGSGGFRYVGRYCLSMLQSNQSFATREEAKAALKEWKKNAEKEGYHIIGRVVNA